MSRFRSIFTRELHGLANSGVGLFCLVAFNLVAGAVFFYKSPPWEFNAVDLNPGFFFLAPIYLLVLVPVLALRIWQDEFRGSMELLLTLPVSVTDVVLGKFAALVAFLAVLLVSTVHLPAALLWLGEPDLSGILAGYLALFLLGALFLAIGVFFASLSETPVPGALLTFAACFLLFALGFPAWLAAMPAGLDVICERISVYSAFSEIAAGRLSLPGSAYFLGAIAFFLALAILRLQTYKWTAPLSAQARRYTLPAVGGFFMVVVALWCLNLFFRAMQYDYVDLTSARQFTLSDTTRSILEQLPQKITVRAYFSEAVPAERKLPMAYARTVLENYQRAGRGKFQLEFLDPVREAKIKTMTDHYNIRPVIDTREGEGESTRTAYYCSILLISGEQSELVNLDFGRLSGLEEQLTLATRQVVQTEIPRIVVLEKEVGALSTLPSRAGQPPPEPRSTEALVLALQNSGRYKVDWLSFGQALPEHTRLVIVHDPVDMPYIVAWQLQQYVRAGGSLMICASPYNTPAYPEKKLIMGELPVSIDRRPTGLEALLMGWGLRFDKGVVVDRLSGRLVALPMKTAARVANPTMKYPLLVSVAGPNLNDDAALTHGLGHVFLDYAVPLQAARAAPAGLTYEWLFKSSPEARLATGDHVAIQPAVYSLDDHGGEQYILGYLIQGTFPTVLEIPAPDKRPVFGTPDGKPWDGETARPGSVLVAGSPSLLHQGWEIRDQGYAPVDEGPGNPLGMQAFTLRAIHRMAGANDLLDLAAKQAVLRPVTRWTNVDEGARRSGQARLAAFGTFLLPAMLLLVGWLRLRGRQKRSAAVEIALPAAAGPAQEPVANLGGRRP